MTEAPKNRPTIQQVAMIAKRLEAITAKFDAIKVAIAEASKPEPFFSVRADDPPMQSFREAEGINHPLYVRASSIPTILADALEACRDDAHANARWALDHHLITEAVAAEFIAHFKA